MAITATVNSAANMLRMANGSHIDTAGTTAAAVDLGFVPRYIRVVNATDRIEFEWFEGMTSGHALQTAAAGTRTLESSGGPTLTVAPAGNTATLGFPVLQNKQYRWHALG